MMHSGKRGPGSPASRRRVSFRPGSERLEERKLMAVVDLANIAQSQASNANLSVGVQEIGAASGDGAGYTVANVGDVTGSGYDSFLISSPTITSATGTGPVLGGGQSKVYLVFGSRQVNSNTVANFLNLTANQRVGDLLTLGTTNQVNPLITTPTDGTPVGFDFDGITFTTSSSNSLLGASVAGVGDLDGDGLNDFALGAPNQGTGGTAYVVFGSTGLVGASGSNVNLDSGAAPTRVASFTSPNAGDQLGSAVAGIGKFLNKGTAVNDLAIGAPGANANAGTVYAISGAAVASAGLGVNINNIAGSSVAFTGQANDRAGAALSTAGNFGDYDGTTTANIQAINGLLIGAPGPVSTGAFTSGRSYLIYGNQTIEGTAAATIAPGGGTYSLATVGVATPTTAIPFPVKGLILNGISANRLGFAVSSAGDFNSDGFDDVMIGAPGGASSGFAAVIYGRSSGTRINGTFQIDPLASSPLSTQYFTSAAAGDLTGFSMAPIALYNGEEAGFLKGLAIGAPGTAGGLGAVYVISSIFSAPGTSLNVSIAAAQTLTVTNSVAGNPPALGTSVSTRPLFAANPYYTVDQDPLDDLIVGAPGYNPNVIGNSAGTATPRPLAGSAFAVSGLKLLDRINPAIGVGSLTPNYSFNPSSSTTITIFVASTPATPTQPAFAPFTQLDPASIFINGVAFPGVTLTSVPDVNGDGVPEASFTISTSGLDTTGTTLPILLSASTLTGLPISASTQVALNGNVPPTPPTPGGGGIGFIAFATARLSPSTFSGFYGGELLPGVETLEHLNSYQPLPATVAYEQFQPAPGFRARQKIFAKGGKTKARLYQAPAGTTVNDKYLGVNTVSKKVLTRGKFKKGETIRFVHKVKVIPRNRQRDAYTSF